MIDHPRPKSQWRRLRLSVRGLIVLVLIVGAGLGWWVRSARIQRRIVKAIEQAGGRAYYDFEWPNSGLFIIRDAPWWQPPIDLTRPDVDLRES